MLKIAPLCYHKIDASGSQNGITRPCEVFRGAEAVLPEGTSLDDEFPSFIGVKIHQADNRALCFQLFDERADVFGETWRGWRASK